MNTGQLNPNDVIRADERDLGFDVDRIAAQRLLNNAVRGRVEVDFETRSVVFADLNGDQALRMCALVKEWNPDDPSSRRWSDSGDPRLTDATGGMITFRPGRVLSIRWFPERHVFEGDAHVEALSAALEILEWHEGQATATTSDTESASAEAGQEAEEVTDADEDGPSPSVVNHGGTSPAPPDKPG